MGERLACFKAYDLRGRVPDELNEELAYAIGRAYAEVIKPEKVVVGRDMRLSSQMLVDALANGLQDSGVDVLDIGLGGTEEVYFATFHLKVDGGIMVTASHNPQDYNGMKLVRAGSRPISGDSGLFDIEAVAADGDFGPVAATRGRRQQVYVRDDYIQHLLGYVDIDALKPLKIVSNPGNGAAGVVMEALAEHLPFEIIKLHHEPDGTFPNGIPNPLLPENRGDTIQAIKAQGADLAAAWDGDFDRCFLFDEQGQFIEGYYIVGLLAESLLQREPGGRVIHDPRLTWNTVEMVEAAGGVPIQSKTGHAFIKERMRAENAIYGGEMSAHHYFRDFAYCDNGMLPWLLVAELMSKTGKSLSELVADRMAKFPASGEINRTVADPAALLEQVEQHYGQQALSIDKTDGLSMDFENWRFNVRKSNTEPVVRLNVESRADQGLMEEKTAELLEMINT